MVTLAPQRLDTLLGTFAGKRIAVLGDLMVDRYYWGSVRRVSPEAPVPVVEVESESVRLGGAANVAHNIRSLGGEPVLVGVIGDDHPGELFLDLAREQQLPSHGILKDATRQTTIKTRVIAQSQHVVRIDNESKSPCASGLREQMLAVLQKEISSLHGIVIEDYNKGVITKELLDAVIALARKHRVIVTVDPKFDNFLEFRGVTVFKPNRREAEEVLGGRLRTTADVERAGKQLLELLQAENVLVTRGEDGMSLFEAGGAITHLESVADNVQDVSGAGDTVISTLTMALAGGASPREACVLANSASAVVVGSVGIVPIRPVDLRSSVLRHAGKDATN
ncbi:MAG: D-glycero-beta-D-manno-heptose-7-phosphate kinase [Bacteroidetes bacterium]|nr:D-glycero-beta-D-manno-heptose-7-phosphate kinase [Bacteroidota bacterium]